MDENRNINDKNSTGTKGGRSNYSEKDKRKKNQGNASRDTSTETEDKDVEDMS